jgi:hypothetical protein
MCQKLGWQPSWDFQKVYKTRQKEFIRSYARFTLEHFSLRQRMTLTTQNLLLATVYSIPFPQLKF